MSCDSAGENARKAEGKRQILTRAARKKAGIAPPTPLFKGQAKLRELDKENSSPTHSQGSHQEETCLPAKTDKTNKCQRVHASSTSSDTSSSSDEGGVEGSGREERRRRRRRKMVWVQCENFSCKKWRRLEPDTHIDLSQHWYCHMHPDPALNSCSVPEEKIKVSKRRGFTFNRLEAGQLVWAKMTGFCPWPAVVSPDPWHDDNCFICEEREGCIYHVEFLGRERTHLWLVEDQVELFYDSHCKPLLGDLKMTKTLNFALQEADILQKLSQQERLERCKYRKSSDSSASGDVCAKKTAKKQKKKKKKCADRQPLSAVKTEPHSTQRCDTTKTKSTVISRTTVPCSDQQPHNSIQPIPISTATALLQSLGIPVTLNPTTESVQPATSLQPVPSGLAKLLSLLSESTASVSRSKPPAPPHTNSCATLTGHSYTQCQTAQATRPQHASSATGDYITTTSGVKLLHSSQAPPTAPVVIPTTRESAAVVRVNISQKLSGVSSGRALQPAGERRERVRKKAGVGGVGCGRKQPLSTSGKKGKRLQISPTIADYFQPAVSSGSLSSGGTSVAPTTVNLETDNVTITGAELAGSTDQCVPNSDAEFTQLESEAETELREIEEMLARYSNSDLPPSSTHDQKPCSEDESKATEEDGSIKAALTEMTEIEGLLQEMSGGQLADMQEAEIIRQSLPTHFCR